MFSVFSKFVQIFRNSRKITYLSELGCSSFNVDAAYRAAAARDARGS